MLLLIALTLHLNGSPLQAEFTSVEAELPRLCGTQSSHTIATLPLERELRIEGQLFEVEREGELLFVATTPGATRKHKLRGDETLRLRWTADGEPFERAVRFERDHESNWSYGPGLARRFEFGGEALYLVDANLDGEYGDISSDGWSREPGGPLLPLARELVVGSRRVIMGEIESDGSSMQARVTVIAGTPGQLDALRRLNDLRASCGLLGVGLAGGLSQGCSEHARYLLANDWDGKTQVNEQEPSSPAATRAGRAAARAGLMVASPPTLAIESLWQDAVGRTQLSKLDLFAIGISEDLGEACVVDASSLGTHKRDATLRWNEFLLAPCDRGTIEVGRVAPLLHVRLPGGAAVDSYVAKLWRIDGRKPREVSLDTLDELESWRCLGARPTTKLKRKARYLLEHRIELGGEARVLRAVFDTK